MRYRSTRGSDYFGFREILFAGLANDGGLFIPEIWPNITEKKDPPKDHEKYKNEQNKFEKYFKENI